MLQGEIWHKVKSNFQQNQQQAFKLCLWGLEGLVWVLAEPGAVEMCHTLQGPARPPAWLWAPGACWAAGGARPP